MKVKDLLVKFSAFRDLLKQHNSLYFVFRRESSHPVQEVLQFQAQQIQLAQLFYPLDRYIDKYTKGRVMLHPATGIKWDVYREAIGDDETKKSKSLKQVILEIEGIIAILHEEDPENEIVLYNNVVEEKKVFISHGVETRALDKLEKFIRVLGIAPIIVKHLASEGKALDDLIDSRMSSCDTVIILATKDDRVEDYYQPRPNVIHEIGLAQEKVKDKIIYLKEDGCVFPSNILPKVWETFTQDNMENAFLKIVKELKAYGLIQ